LRRAVAIIRVSARKGREGDSFASPEDQRARIVTACERDDLELTDVLEEIDVSGGTPLHQRQGLRRAVEAVEAGRADVVVVAYFDRLVRSLRVQDEVVSRVEAAGGRVLAVDFGEVTGDTAAQWLSGTMIGAVSEYYRRSVKERSGEAQARAVLRGVLPYPNVPPGYLRGPDRKLVADPRVAPIVAQAFRMRAAGNTVAQVREHLGANGVRRSYHGTLALLSSRVVLGEIHFGKLANLSAHEPIVDPDTWRAVQRARILRGRKPKSQRLLARLGVLRCATCNARMVVGSQRQQGKLYGMYRCPPNGDCPRRVAISSEIAERVVVDHVREALADAQGRASAEQNARAAERALAQAQAALDSAIRAFSGLQDEPVARERLAELAAVRDRAQELVERLGGTDTALTVSAAEDWDLLSLQARRGLIRAVVERALVAPGRGPGRVTVELRV
jgi:DNA invertase Pin-like site-specific DNA recombinase